MIEFLPGCGAVILENADVLEPCIALQILNAQRGQTQELFDFRIARVPEMAIMAKVLEQDLVSADGSHAVVKAVTAARRLAFNVIKRMRMHKRARGPRAAIEARQIRDYLGWLGGGTAKLAGSRTRRNLTDIIAGNHPRTGDGIFTKFHGLRRTKEFAICNW